MTTSKRDIVQPVRDQSASAPDDHRDKKPLVTNVTPARPEALAELGDEVRERVQRQAKRVQQTAHEVQEKAQQTVHDVQERAQLTAHEVHEKAHQTVHDVQEKAQQRAAVVQERAQHGATVVQERARRLRTQIGFQRETRNPIRHRLAILSANALSWFAWILPPLVRRLIAHMVGLAIYHLNRGYRENLYANLRQVLGPEASQRTIEATARSAFRTSVSNFIDLIMIPRRSRQDIMQHFGPDVLVANRINELRKAGKGVVIITGHIGPFDLVGQALSVKGYPLTVVTGRTTFRFVFDAVSHWRGSKGVKIVEPTPSGVREIIRALRRNELVAFVTDRDFFFNGRPVTFFGAETTLPPGAVRIARDSGAPILPVFSRRVGTSSEWWAPEPFWIDKTPDTNADVDAGLLKVVEAFETAISAEPGQWLMFQRVWPSD